MMACYSNQAHCDEPRKHFALSLIEQRLMMFVQWELTDLDDVLKGALKSDSHTKLNRR